MRRRTLIAGVLTASAAAAAGVYRFTNLFVRHYPPTAYDDVLAYLVDRPNAARLGAVLTGMPDAKALGVKLRWRLRAGLAAAVARDVALGRLAEADGWVMPQSLALLAALAAKA